MLPVFIGKQIWIEAIAVTAKLCLDARRAAAHPIAL
jgi:hypothetical protein